MDALLDVRGLTVELPTERGWIRPVNDVAFTLDAGETLGIVGESGSGKTMLVLALMGLTPPGAKRIGEAWLLQRSSNGNHGPAESPGARSPLRPDLTIAAPAERRAIRGREIAMIFQEPMTALNPVMRVGAQIEEAISVHEARVSAADAHPRAVAALERAAVPEPELRA